MPARRGPRRRMARPAEGARKADPAADGGRVSEPRRAARGRTICHRPGPRKSSRATTAKAAATRGLLSPPAAVTCFAKAPDDFQFGLAIHLELERRQPRPKPETADQASPAG